MGDLVTVARNRLANTRGAGESRTPTSRVMPMGETQTRYHVQIDVDDERWRAGRWQARSPSTTCRSRPYGRRVATMTPNSWSSPTRANDAAFSATVKSVAGMDIVRDVTSVMRVEGGDE
jgi:homoserine dehydrogenase